MQYEYGSRIYEIPVDQIEVDYNFNTRQFDQMDLGGLIAAIKARGQEEAGKVMHQPNHPTYPFKLLTGFRRFSAIGNTDIKTYKAIVVAECSLADQLTYNYVENQERKALTIYDEAMVMKRFHEMGENEVQLTARFGLSRGKGQVRTMLLKMLDEDKTGDLANLAKADLLGTTLIRDLFSVKNQVDRVVIVEDLKKKAKFKIKLSVDKSAVATKIPRADMLMERNKAARKRFMSWALGLKIPFSQWPMILTWINGEYTDNQLMDVLQEMKNDPCNYPEFKEIISNAEHYTQDPGSFLSKVLSFQDSVKDLELERPVNGIPFID